jgi:chain length determinant protein (polysaccharide antigen chain regulator)
VPDWYLYGEKALLQRIEILESRTSDEPFIPELVPLDIEKNKLEISIIDQTGAKSMQVSQLAFTPTFPIKPKKRRIILLAFFGSFMMSIFLALFMNIFKPDEIHST